jgi:hypothetical protein
MSFYFESNISNPFLIVFELISVLILKKCKINKNHSHHEGLWEKKCIFF